MSLPRLNIVTALACEARFFLDHFQLRRVENLSVYSIYANSSKTIYLMVSGIGKIKSAAALSYLHGFSEAPLHSCYLNAGIAGADQANIGDIFLAHKIMDAATEHVFYPWPVLMNVIPSMTVLTIAKPLPDYPQQQLVDMEAAGFHQAALGFVTQEQIQTMKIVSDNSTASLQQVNSKLVVSLFEKNADIICKLVEHLLNFSQQEAAYHQPVDYYADIISRFHFSDYQRHQLQELLRRWKIVFPQSNPLTSINNEKNAAVILSSLELSLMEASLCK